MSEVIALSWRAHSTAHQGLRDEFEIGERLNQLNAWAILFSGMGTADTKAHHLFSAADADSRPGLAIVRGGRYA